MTRYLALFLLAATTPVAAAGLPRNFSVTSFDRVRIEGPYKVTLATGRAPAARAEGSAAALDAVDLRVEGTTLILRRRGNAPGDSGPVAVSLSTPSLRTALLVGAGSLSVDRMSGLSVDVAMQGSGALRVGTILADRVNASAQGSGLLEIAGRTKQAALVARGLASLSGERLLADELTLAADGAGTVGASAKSRATINAAGTVAIRIAGNPTCVQRLSGSVVLEGCKPAR